MAKDSSMRRHGMYRIAAGIAVCAFTFSATAALAKGPTPKFTATATVSAPSAGQCSSTATASWKNVTGLVDEVDFTFQINGLTSGGEFDNFPGAAAKTGSHSAGAPPSVPSGATFSFTATYKRLGSTVSTATSNTVTC
jgi:hypothetical protein